MVEFNSQLSGMQHEEQISKPESGVSDNSSGQQYTKQEENKDVEISDIIQILRTTKVQQLRGNFHYREKFCALGAIMHDKYGWDGVNSLRFNVIRQQLRRILGIQVFEKIMSLNDHDGKSFAEIADWLEKNYLNTKHNSTLRERKIEVLIKALNRHIERLETMLSFLNASHDPHNDLLYAHEQKVNAVKQEIHFVEKQRQKLKKLKEIGNEYVKDLLTRFDTTKVHQCQRLCRT